MSRFLPALLLLALFVPALAQDEDYDSEWNYDVYTDEEGTVWVEYESETEYTGDVPEVPDPTPVDDTAYDEDGNAYYYDEATGEWVPVGD